MKLWRMELRDRGEGTVWVWHPTQRAARTDAAKARRGETYDVEHPDSILVESVDVPTTKVGLIAWLNANCDRHNG